MAIRRNTSHVELGAGEEQQQHLVQPETSKTSSTSVIEPVVVDSDDDDGTTTTTTTTITTTTTTTTKQIVRKPPKDSLFSRCGTPTCLRSVNKAVLYVTMCNMLVIIVYVAFSSLPLTAVRSNFHRGLNNEVMLIESPDQRCTPPPHLPFLDYMPRIRLPWRSDTCPKVTRFSQVDNTGRLTMNCPVSPYTGRSEAFYLVLREYHLNPTWIRKNYMQDWLDRWHAQGSETLVKYTEPVDLSNFTVVTTYCNGEENYHMYNTVNQPAVERSIAALTLLREQEKAQKERLAIGDGQENVSGKQQEQEEEQGGDSGDAQQQQQQQQHEQDYEKQQRETTERLDPPLDLLFFMIDSLSRAHFLRALPLTTKLLEDLKDSEDYQVFQFFRYNSVGMNSGPNLGPMFTGETWYDNIKGLLERESPFFWQEAQSRGYITGFLVEECFGYILRYWPRGATHIERLKNAYLDHFETMAFCHPDYKTEVYRYAGARCMAGKNTHLYTMDYIKQFYENYPDTPKIFMSLMMEAHESTLTAITLMDEDLRDWLKYMMDKHFNNTITFLGADHGIRHGYYFYLGKYLNLGTGGLEHELPSMFAIVPRWLLKKYPFVEHYLTVNQQELVTAYDIHTTWQHITHFPTMPEHSSDSYSLIGERIPSTRTCADALIPYFYCSCDEKYDYVLMALLTFQFFFSVTAITITPCMHVIVKHLRSRTIPFGGKNI